MNHYPHHIGDFNNATRHLTRVERSLYRDLIELYYDKEAPLPLDIERLARLVLANTQEERAALEVVLQEFFTAHTDGWRNARCDLELEAYRGKIEAAQRAGRASAERRFGNRNTDVKPSQDKPTTGDQQAFNDGSTNQNQNQNQNHVSPPGDTARSASQPKSWVTAEHMVATCPGLTNEAAADYLNHRRSLKKGVLSDRAWRDIAKEIEKSRWPPDDAVSRAMSRGWVGLQADWLTREERGHAKPSGTPVGSSRGTIADRARAANNIAPAGRVIENG